MSQTKLTNPRTDIVIAGVGGQGTVLASKLLAQAAMISGDLVRAAETIGMAQRGGSVLGHVRISHQVEGYQAAAEQKSTAPLSPLVPEGGAELLIGFEPGETVRALGFLRKGGTVVTVTQAIAPVTAALSNSQYDGQAELAYLSACKNSGRLAKLVLVNGAQAIDELGSTRILNVVLIGAALATGCLGISDDAIATAIETLVKPGYVHINKQALSYGRQLGQAWQQPGQQGQAGQQPGQQPTQPTQQRQAGQQQPDQPEDTWF